MSKVSIQGDISGTGNFTIKAPNSNVDRTLTLRDETGDLVTTATDLEPQVKDSLNATGSAPVYACRAWVNFDGTGTVSIRDSGNVSSITDNGVGRYTVNFSTAMPDGNYTVVTDCVAGLGANVVASAIDQDFLPSVGSVGVVSKIESISTQDKDFMFVSVFR